MIENGPKFEEKEIVQHVLGQKLLIVAPRMQTRTHYVQKADSDKFVEEQEIVFAGDYEVVLENLDHRIVPEWQLKHI